MAGTLPPADRNKLVNILARLGSDFDGERAAAALLASRMIAGKGLVWADLIGTAPVYQPQAQPQGPTWGDGNMTLCARHLGALNTWERQFVLSLQLRRKLTHRQVEILAGIAGELRKRGFA